MKKIYLILLMVVVTFAPTDMLIATSRQPTTREIAIRDIRFPSTPHKPLRSAVPTVYAMYLGDMSLLEISFTMNVGNVSIYVINNMGQCISKYTCNTQYESEVYMNISLPEGMYSLKVVGADYEGEGAFEIL